jgi:hypothetical protein
MQGDGIGLIEKEPQDAQAIKGFRVKIVRPHENPSGPLEDFRHRRARHDNRQMVEAGPADRTWLWLCE